MSEYSTERDTEYVALADTLPVYFAYSEKSREVKIGFSRDVRTRIRQLNSASWRDGRENVVLIGWLIGGPRVETELHELFQSHRTSGEWFMPAPAMADVIEEYCSNGEPPIVPSPKYRVTADGYWGAVRRLEAAEVDAATSRQPRTVHEFEDGRALVTVDLIRPEINRPSALRRVAAR